MATPLIVALFLGVPVAVAWGLKQRSQRRRAKPFSKESHGEKLETDWTQRMNKTVDAFYQNVMFWLFICFPTVAFASLETFICREISGKSYLTADFNEDCPWEYPNGFWKLEKWSWLAYVSAVFVVIYILGTLVIMIWVMIHHRVPALARQKVEASLISALITEYTKVTSTASTKKLASFMGMPPSLAASNRTQTKGQTWEPNAEFRQRAFELFSEIFPEHAACAGQACIGHKLPKMARTFLREMAYPHDVERLDCDAKKWFARIDLNEDQKINSDELKLEFERIGLSARDSADMLKYHGMGVESMLSVDEFVGMIYHVLENTVENLSAADLIALGHFIEKFDEDKNGLLDFDEFVNLTLRLVSTSFVFNGPESFKSLSLTQLDMLRTYQWRRRHVIRPEQEDKTDNDGAEMPAFPCNREEQISRVQEQFNVQDEPELEESAEKGGEIDESNEMTTDQEIKINQILTSIQKLSRDSCGFDDVDDGQVLRLKEDLSSLIDVLIKLKAQISLDLQMQTGTSDARMSTQMLSSQNDPNKPSVHSRLLRRQTMKEANLNEPEIDQDGQVKAYSMLIQVGRLENDLKLVLREMVLDMGFSLKKEGVITVPPLAWDGSLGPEEGDYI